MSELHDTYTQEPTHGPITTPRVRVVFNLSYAADWKEAEEIYQIISGYMNGQFKDDVSQGFDNFVAGLEIDNNTKLAAAIEKDSLYVEVLVTMANFKTATQLHAEDEAKQRRKESNNIIKELLAEHRAQIAKRNRAD